MTHSGPFQPLLFCDSVKGALVPESLKCLLEIVPLFTLLSLQFAA